MKLFNIDVSLKYVLFKLDGEDYIVQFRSSWRKGIYDILIYKNGKEAKDVEITGAYPPLRQIIYDAGRIWFPIWVKSKIRELRRLRNR